MARSAISANVCCSPACSLRLQTRGLGGLDKQAAFPAGTGLVRGGVVYLLEHARHAQQVGRFKRTQVRQQGFGVRQITDHAVIGGDGGVLDESREAVGQRQEEQQARMVVKHHFMQRLRRRRW